MITGPTLDQRERFSGDFDRGSERRPLLAADRGSPRVPSARADRLRILKQRHESEIHVQLLVTVKQRQPRIVGDEIKSQLLEPAEHHDVFDHAGRGLAANVRQFKTVAVQVQGMNVVAGVAEFQPIAATLRAKCTSGFIVCIENASPLSVH